MEEQSDVAISNSLHHEIATQTTFARNDTIGV